MPETVSYEPVTLDTPDVSPLRELLRLALPTVAQMVSYTVMQFIDTWLLAQALGPMAPTAAGRRIRPIRRRSLFLWRGATS